MATKYIFEMDPRVAWGAVTGLIAIAAPIAWKVGKFILNNKRIHRMAAAAIDLQDGEKDNDSGDLKVSHAIMEILRRIENDRIADRNERNRQWERIEQSVALAREHAQAAWAINQTLQHFASGMENAHRHHADQIKDLGDNVISLSNWLRDRAAGPGWPSYHTRPPLQGS